MENACECHGVESIQLTAAGKRGTSGKTRREGAQTPPLSYMSDFCAHAAVHQGDMQGALEQPAGDAGDAVSSPPIRTAV
jgi:hypothetical protein